MYFNHENTLLISWDYPFKKYSYIFLKVNDEHSDYQFPEFFYDYRYTVNNNPLKRPLLINMHRVQCRADSVPATVTLWYAHRNQTSNRKGAYIISSIRPSHGQFERRCCPQALLRIFSEVTYIGTVGNSSLLKIYTLPNHTITIGVCILWWWR
jgi:hypothetical protein